MTNFSYKKALEDTLEILSKNLLNISWIILGFIILFWLATTVFSWLFDENKTICRNNLLYREQSEGIYIPDVRFSGAQNICLNVPPTASTESSGFGWPE